MHTQTQPFDAATDINDELEALLSDPPAGTDFFLGLNRCIQQAHAQLGTLSPSARSQGSQDWRDRFHRWFLQAPCIERAFSKPLGYPGDYGVMEMGYRNQPEGSTPLGRRLHQWFSSGFRGSAAVRSRRRRAVLEMERHAANSEGPWRALAVASGSSRELRDMVMESYLAERLHIVCVDQDPRALKFAEARYEAVALRYGRRLGDVQFVTDSVRRILKEGAERHGPMDFVYSLGLYDYLPEAPAQTLTRRLYDTLAPGGRMMIANYSPDCDARPAIELIMDWHLIYRSEDEMRTLASTLPDAARVHVERDETGTLWWLVIDRPPVC